MIKVIFSDCDYADDFEAIVDASEVFDTVPKYRFNLWLKAYDSSMRENEREQEVNDKGYAFDCYVYVLDDEGNPVDTSYAPRMAKTRQSAEDTLVKMAMDIAKDEAIAEKLKAVV